MNDPDKIKESVEVKEETNNKMDVARLYFGVAKIIKHNMRKTFECSGITFPQSIVIHALIENGEMKITDLSNKIDLSNSTISGIIDRLEKQQLVIRTRSDEDRRTVYVKVTPKVEEFHRGIHQNVEESFNDLLSKGTQDEIDKIIVGLETMKRILKDRKD